MKLIDVTVPVDASLPIYPGNTPFTIEAVRRIARGGTWNVSTLHMRAQSGTHVDAPRHYFVCLPLRVVGADGAPARVLLRRN